MTIEKIINSIENINYASSGCSNRRDIASYNILLYLKNNSEINELVENLKDYYNNSENRYLLVNNNNIDLLESLLAGCDNLLLEKNYINNNNINIKLIKSDKSIDKKYINFVDCINLYFDEDYKINNEILLLYTKKYADRIEEEYNKTKQKFEQINKKIEELSNNTNNLLLSFITSLLGISLVSAIVSCIFKIKDLKTVFLLIYSIVLIIVLTIGFSYIVINKFSKKTIFIIIIIILYLFFLGTYINCIYN